MWQYGGIPSVVEETRHQQATSDMQHERWQCKKDECNIMADRPNSLVERKGNRQTKPSIPRFDSSCLQGNV